MNNSPPSGWYDDPQNPNGMRYWDGVQWTQHVAPKTQPAPVPAKRNWFLRHKLLTAILAIFVLGVITSQASGGGSEPTASPEPAASVAPEKERTPAANQEPEPTEEPTYQPGEEVMNDKNLVGNWKILNAPLDDQFGGEYGMFKNVDLRIKNISEDEDEAWLEIRLTKGNELLTTFDCISDTVRPGEVSTLRCSTLDDYRPGWTEYEIKNTF